jgi:hypothetical protein
MILLVLSTGNLPLVETNSVSRAAVLPLPPLGWAHCMPALRLKTEPIPPMLSVGLSIVPLKATQNVEVDELHGCVRLLALRGPGQLPVLLIAGLSAAVALLLFARLGARRMLVLAALSGATALLIASFTKLRLPRSHVYHSVLIMVGVFGSVCALHALGVGGSL